MNDIYIPEPIRDLLLDQPFDLDDCGHSGSTVLIFADKVLKMQKASHDAAAECNMMKWLESKLPVPKCLYHTVENNIDYLLMNRIEGKMSCSDEYMQEGQTMVKALADGLLKLWQVDITDCPMNRTLDSKLADVKKRIDDNTVSIEDLESGTAIEYGFKTATELYDWLVNNRPKEEPVFSHGDYCLPNIFIDNGKLSGFIDLGNSGIADKWYDIALLYRSLKHNCEGKFSKKTYDSFDPSLLFDALGVEPDWEKIGYYILLDELF